MKFKKWEIKAKGLGLLNSGGVCLCALIAATDDEDAAAGNCADFFDELRNCFGWSR